MSALFVSPRQILQSGPEDKESRSRCASVSQIHRQVLARLFERSRSREEVDLDVLSVLFWVWLQYCV